METVHLKTSLCLTKLGICLLSTVLSLTLVGIASCGGSRFKVEEQISEEDAAMAAFLAEAEITPMVDLLVANGQDQILSKTEFLTNNADFGVFEFSWEELDAHYEVVTRSREPFAISFFGISASLREEVLINVRHVSENGDDIEPDTTHPHRLCLMRIN